MNLVGTWVLDETDAAAAAALGDVLLNFSNDGELTYVVRAEETDQIIYLTYAVDEGTITTDQPSAPRVERTAFSQPEDGVLILSFGGTPCRFKRVQLNSADAGEPGSAT